MRPVDPIWPVKLEIGEYVAIRLGFFTNLPIIRILSSYEKDSFWESKLGFHYAMSSSDGFVTSSFVVSFKTKHESNRSESKLTQIANLSEDPINSESCVIYLNVA